MGASVLIAMLLSLPMAGDVQAAVTAQTRDRVTAPPIQVLGAEIIRSLCFGIRYEADPDPVRLDPREPGPSTRAILANRPHPVPLLEVLTDLPPPYARL